MKSKLIQCATLLVFVMTIVFMAQAPNGFGHGLGGDHTNMDHPPQFEVDYWTGRPCPPFIYSVDPRSNTDYSGSSGNGTGSASSWALRYYASPLYNGYGGQVYDPNEANAEQINAKRTREAQMVFGVRVDLSASAGNSSCSGSVTPNVTEEMGLTTASSWAGIGRVVLKISEKKDAHWRSDLTLFKCVKFKADGSSYDSGRREIEIRVSDSTITDKKSGGIDVEVGHGPGKVTGKWSVGTEIARNEVHAYPYGFSFTLESSLWYWLIGVASQQDKSATVTGRLGGIKAPDIYAVFIGEHECYW